MNDIFAGFPRVPRNLCERFFPLPERNDIQPEGAHLRLVEERRLRQIHVLLSFQQAQGMKPVHGLAHGSCVHLVPERGTSTNRSTRLSEINQILLVNRR